MNSKTGFSLVMYNQESALLKLVKTGSEAAT